MMPQAETIEAMLDFHHHEAHETAGDRRWARYCRDVARLLGVPHLDGDQEIDGYSLDYAFDFFTDGLSATEAAEEFRAAQRDTMTERQRQERTDYEIMLLRTSAARRGATPTEIERNVLALQEGS